jgi:hypothetical protein
MTTTDTLTPVTPERLDFARLWYAGTNSALYAIASTGALTCGAVRPSVLEDGEWRQMTDAEWHSDLLRSLLRELNQLHRHGISTKSGDWVTALDWAREVARDLEMIDV